MKIGEIFERDISRSINGVVKADQLDASSKWQELDEFVVTKELAKHFNVLVHVMLEAAEAGGGAADKNGIWVSGFFGCGKSHLIKVLSYLMEDAELSFDGKKRHAVDFFDTKFDDAMLQADLKRVVSVPTDAILFNIDTKANHAKGREALLQVFLKVLNEKQGYSGDHPHIAHLERHLERKGRLGVFHEAFERAAGSPWVKERDAWEFHRDQVILAAAEALGQSTESVEAWVDSAKSDFSLTIENFAKWVKQYLESKGPNHRIMFLVDEVGQFIGNDTHLMLNLQTITEQLGTVCAGRAWVVVTSQEDLDAVLGELTASKQHDFSKIQGRFKTRLSLSSANVDEVIKRRLLAKNEKAAAPLAAAYEGKHDILRNQLSFVRTGMTFKQYTHQNDFADCYPFAAYQFTLVQKVFESIRKAGATGLHLSQGERSTLDAFQSAAKQVADRKIGVLVPFHRFYPAVEGFLDTAVKRTIDQAGDNHALEPFDITILKVLFLVRYVDEMPGSVDNLVTLCVDEIDADKLALRKRIEEALNRLESETLIARNGDLYFFLTNEERDIGREIKSQVIGSGEEERALGTLIFEDILGGARKHTYKETGRDFQFNRLCDDHPVGNKMDGAIEVAVISPLHTNYVEFQNDNTAAMRAMEVEGRVLVVLPDDSALGRELRTYLQTEHYVKTKHTGTLPDSTKRILRDRTEDNRARRERLLGSIRTLIASAKWYTYSKKLDLHASEPKAALGEAMEYLIANAYPKMGYIAHLHPNPKHEIQSILRANDVEQIQMGLDTPESNPLALKDLREYMRLCSEASREVILSDLIEKRYGMRPYGWPELEIVLLVARLAVLKEITLEAESGPLPLERAYEHLTATSKQRKVVMALRQVVGGGVIKDARELCQELFGQQGPFAEDALYVSAKAQLATWDSNLAQFASLAETGRYPGFDAIDGARHLLRKFVAEPNSKTFLERFVQNKPELLSIAEDYQDLKDFYINQRHVWEKLQRAEKIFSQNALHLEQDERARPALDRMRLILADTKPYSKLHEVNALIAVVQEVNDKLVEAARDPVVMRLTSFLDVVAVELEKVSADAYLRSQALAELNRLLEVAQAHEVSIAHLSELNGSSEDAFGRAMDAIAEGTSPQPDPVGGEPVPPPMPRRVICAKDYAPAELLQTDADVDGFVGRLSDALKKALAEGVRVQVK